MTTPTDEITRAIDFWRDALPEIGDCGGMDDFKESHEAYQQLSALVAENKTLREAIIEKDERIAWLLVDLETEDNHP